MSPIDTLLVMHLGSFCTRYNIKTAIGTDSSAQSIVIIRQVEEASSIEQGTGAAINSPFISVTKSGFVPFSIIGGPFS